MREPRSGQEARRAAVVPFVLAFVVATTLLGTTGVVAYRVLSAGSAPAAPGRLSDSKDAAGGNPVQQENDLPGSTSWSMRAAPGREIEGYSSEPSVAPGSSIHLHISTTPPASYRIEVYRLGWYGGAGARQVACLPSCSGSEPGSAEPEPDPDPQTGRVGVSWPVTDIISVPTTWVSGYYIAEARLQSGADAGSGTVVPVIVRSDGSRTAAILLEAPVNTWQAYNSWGGKSLYGFNSTGGVAAVEVSFDRPYPSNYATVFSFEYQLVRFLEREGYDVSYTTDVDTQNHPGELLRHRLVISAGHDEYWTKGMRDAFEAARDAGINLAFIGADIADWQIRYADGDRTIIEYRDGVADPEPDPALKTIRFRALTPPRPECELRGVQFNLGQSWAGYSYTVNAGAFGDPWFANTGFASGSVLQGLVGYEWDQIVPGCSVPNLTTLFSYAGNPPADVVKYTAPSGATIFSTGSLFFTWGLDDWGTGGTHADPRLQQFMRNLLDDLSEPKARSAGTASTGAHR